MGRKGKGKGGEENARNKLIPPLLLKHKVNVRWSPWMSMHTFQKPPHWPIMRNWIANGNNGLKPKLTICIRFHDSTAIRACPISPLNVIVPRTVRLPDINLDTKDGAASRVFYCAENETGSAVGIRRYIFSRWEQFCIMSMKRTKNGAFSSVGGFRVVNGIDKKGEAEDVGEKDEFLGSSCQSRFPSCLIFKLGCSVLIVLAYIPYVTAYLPNFDQEIQRCHPFLGTQSYLSCKIMQMGD